MEICVTFYIKIRVNLYNLWAVLFLQQICRIIINRFPALAVFRRFLREAYIATFLTSHRQLRSLICELCVICMTFISPAACFSLNFEPWTRFSALNQQLCCALNLELAALLRFEPWTRVCAFEPWTRVSAFEPRASISAAFFFLYILVFSLFFSLFSSFFTEGGGKQTVLASTWTRSGFKSYKENSDWSLKKY